MRHCEKKKHGTARQTTDDNIIRRICFACHIINPLTPNDLYRGRAVSPLKIKIPSKNMREKSTTTPVIHSVY
jgi:hypothetical protein